MADQRLVYTLEGDATSLKKAIEEAEAANRKLTESMVRRGVEMAGLQAAEAALRKIEAAAAAAKRQLDFLRRGVEISGNVKQFAKDIDQASNKLEKLTLQAAKQRTVVGGFQGAVGQANMGVVAAQEQVANANAQRRIALLEAERQARIAEGNQILTNLRAQAAANEQLAAVERRRMADEAAGQRMAAANQRVQATRLNTNVAAAQAAYRADVSSQSSQLFGQVKASMLNSMGASLGKVNAAALESKVRFNEALTAAQQFGSGGQSSVRGMVGQFALLAAQVIGVQQAIRGVKAVIEAGISVQQIKQKFLFAAEGDAAKAAADWEFARAEAQRLALPIKSLADNYANMKAAVGGTNTTLAETQHIFSAFSATARVVGLDEQQVNSAFLAVNQSLSIGKIRAQEMYIQLAQVIPGAVAKMAAANHMSLAEFQKSMELGLIPSRHALKLFSDALEEIAKKSLPSALDTFQARTVLLSNAWFEFKAQLADSGVLNAVGEQVIALTAKLEDMAKTGELQKIGNDIGKSLSNLLSILVKVTQFVIEHRSAIFNLGIAYAGLKFAGAIAGFIEIGAKAYRATAAVDGLRKALAMGAALSGIGGGAEILAAGGATAVLGTALAALAVTLGVGVGVWLLFRDTAVNSMQEAIKKADEFSKANAGMIKSINDKKTDLFTYADAVKKVGEAYEHLQKLQADQKKQQEELSHQPPTVGVDAMINDWVKAKKAALNYWDEAKKAALNYWGVVKKERAREIDLMQQLQDNRDKPGGGRAGLDKLEQVRKRAEAIAALKAQTAIFEEGQRLKAKSDQIAKDERDRKAEQDKKVRAAYDAEKDTIEIAVEAQIEAVKKSHAALAEAEKNLGKIAEKTIAFQHLQAKGIEKGAEAIKTADAALDKIEAKAASRSQKAQPKVKGEIAQATDAFAAEIAAATKPKTDKDLTDVSTAVAGIRRALSGGDAKGAQDQIKDARSLILDLAKSGKEAQIFLQGFAKEIGVLALQAGEQIRAEAEAKVKEEEAKLRTLNELSKEIGKIDLNVNVDAAEKEMQALHERTQAFYDANPILVKVIAQKKIDIELGVEKQAAKTAFAPSQATGGPIRGPGTGTSDDVPIWASDGEHVLTAREVAAAGGHENILRLRRLLLQHKLPGFALGGAISNAAAAISSRMAIVRAAPPVDYAGRILDNVLSIMAPPQALAAGGMVEAGHGNVINLTLPGGQEFELRASDSVAQELQRTVRMAALKHGRRR